MSKGCCSRMVSWALVVVFEATVVDAAFQTSSMLSRQQQQQRTLFTATTTTTLQQGQRRRRNGSLFLSDDSPSDTSSDEGADSAFSAFAESLEEDSLFGEDDYHGEEMKPPTWQENLEALLDPSTPLAKRQIVVSDLINSNEDIQASVRDALTQRTIDPLLTPTGKRIQDGTKAVARQLTSDILPTIANAASTTIPRPGGGSGSVSGEGVVPEDLPSLLPKLGTRVFNAISSQARKQLTQVQEDLKDPSRIPKRLSQQTSTLATEARNVFREMPEGLEGPSYTVLAKRTEGDCVYEIRRYDAYTVASTSMSKVGEVFSADDIAASGAAFNTLAAYIFGANEDGRTLDMTTPVTTTSLGEMRFYLKTDGPLPVPIREDNDGLYDRGIVDLVDVPAATLAVVRFSGFVTEGEISRQKDVLLSELALDGISVDVPHGTVVPHVIFQYNPPYTVPILRRNELAVPVLFGDFPAAAAAAASPAEEGSYFGSANDDDVSPSDVE